MYVLEGNVCGGRGGGGGVILSILYIQYLKL